MLNIDEILSEKQESPLDYHNLDDVLGKYDPKNSGINSGVNNHDIQDIGILTHDQVINENKKRDKPLAYLARVERSSETFDSLDGGLAEIFNNHAKILSGQYEYNIDKECKQTGEKINLNGIVYNWDDKKYANGITKRGRNTFAMMNLGKMWKYVLEQPKERIFSEMTDELKKGLSDLIVAQEKNYYMKKKNPFLKRFVDYKENLYELKEFSHYLNQNFQVKQPETIEQRVLIKPDVQKDVITIAVNSKPEKGLFKRIYSGVKSLFSYRKGPIEKTPEVNEVSNSVVDRLNNIVKTNNENMSLMNGYNPIIDGSQTQEKQESPEEPETHEYLETQIPSYAPSTLTGINKMIEAAKNKKSTPHDRDSIYYGVDNQNSGREVPDYSIEQMKRWNIIKGNGTRQPKNEKIIHLGPTPDKKDFAEPDKRTASSW